MPSSTLTSKGQITLPKEVREHLHVSAGDRLDFLIDDDGQVLIQRLIQRLLLGAPATAPVIEPTTTTEERMVPPCETSHESKTGEPTLLRVGSPVCFLIEKQIEKFKNFHTKLPVSNNSNNYHAEQQ